MSDSSDLTSSPLFSSASPLWQMFPGLAVRLPNPTELRSDLDRLAGYLLPDQGDVLRLAGPGYWFAWVIEPDGKLRKLRASRLRTIWTDQSALSARIDDLVARDQVRALAVATQTQLHRSDGRHATEEPALHMLVEHRAGFAADLLVPVEWGPVHDRRVREPVWVDRVKTGRPYRRWPGADGGARRAPWRAEGRAPDDHEDAVEFAYDRYRTFGEYYQLLTAIEIMDHRLRAIPEGDERWPEAADRLAGLLTTRFRQEGLDADLERGLALSRAAVRLGGRRPLHRLRLAERLGVRYLAHGRLADLEEALAESRGTLEGNSADTDRLEMTAIAAELLLLAYSALGDFDSVRRAGDLTGAVLAAGDGGARLFSVFSAINLCIFRETAERGCAKMAVLLAKAAVGGTPERGPERPSRLRDLGIALTASYELSRDEAELDLAYRVLADALDRTHDAAPQRPSIELALISARAHRLSRARLLSLLEDLGHEQEWIVGGEEYGLPPARLMADINSNRAEALLAHLPEGSPLRPEVLSLLATYYRDLFEISRTVDKTRVTPTELGMQLVGGVDRLQTAASMARLAADEWEALFANSTVGQKLAASRSTGQLYAFAVDAWLELGRLAEHTDPDDRTLGFRTSATGMVLVSPPASAASAHAHAVVMAEAAKARLLTEQLSRGDLAAPPSVPDGLLQRERALIAELAELDTAAVASRGTGSGGGTGSERRARLVAELDQVWASIGERGLAAAEYVTLRRKEPPDFGAIESAVLAERDDTVVFSLYVLESRTALFSELSDGSGYIIDEFPLGTKDWAEVLRRFSRELPRSHGQDLVPSTWERPLRPLLAKAAERAEGRSRVVLAPHGPSGALSWTFLTRDWESASGGPPAVSIVPSLGVLGRLQRRPGPRTRRSVVIGNPTGDLAYAELEAREVASVLGVEPILGPAASTAALDAAAPEARILHLAAHAAFDPDSPSDSYVLLCDARWPARQALRSRLDAELVILSGCETGSLGPLAGEELMGLSYAFLHAGARAVIVSLWPVSDAVTARFMGTFHREHRAGVAVAEALARAAQEIRRTHPHPWYWAGFTLVGGHD